MKSLRLTWLLSSPARGTVPPITPLSNVVIPMLLSELESVEPDLPFPSVLKYCLSPLSAIKLIELSFADISLTNPVLSTPFSPEML